MGFAVVLCTCVFLWLLSDPSITSTILGLTMTLGLCFRDFDKKLQNALLDFLKARGVNNDLSVFLHQFMANKDRTELIRWLEKTMSLVED